MTGIPTQLHTLAPQNLHETPPRTLNGWPSGALSLGTEQWLQFGGAKNLCNIETLEFNSSPVVGEVGGCREEVILMFGMTKKPLDCELTKVSQQPKP